MNFILFNLNFNFKAHYTTLTCKLMQKLYKCVGRLLNQEIQN